MEGIEFYFHLRFMLNETDIVGAAHNYTFVKWMKDGGLQFRINPEQRKKIPGEIIIAAFHVYNRGILIDQAWIEANGHQDWCFPEVLNYLIEHYPNQG